MRKLDNRVIHLTVEPLEESEEPEPDRSKGPRRKRRPYCCRPQVTSTIFIIFTALTPMPGVVLYHISWLHFTALALELITFAVSIFCLYGIHQARKCYFLYPFMIECFAVAVLAGVIIFTFAAESPIAHAAVHLTFCYLCIYIVCFPFFYVNFVCLLYEMRTLNQRKANEAKDANERPTTSGGVTEKIYIPLKNPQRGQSSIMQMVNKINVTFFKPPQ